MHDPWGDPEEERYECGIEVLPGSPENGAYDAVVLAVAHDQYREMGADGLRALTKGHAVGYDIKGLFPLDRVDARL